MQTVIALAAKHDLRLHQLDITSAFLNGELKEIIYMKQTEGFKIKNKDYPVMLTKVKYLWTETIGKMLE